MLTYPQMVMSELPTVAPPATDYPQIDTLNPLGANLLWMADLTQFSKDSQGVVISGATARNSAGATLTLTDYLEAILSTSLGSMVGGFTVCVHMTPSAWDSNGRIMTLRAGSSEVVEFSRYGSDTKAFVRYPSLTYYGGSSSGYIITSTSSVQFAFTVTPAGEMKLYQNGVLFGSKTATLLDEFGPINAVRIAEGVAASIQQAYVFNAALSAEGLASLLNDPRQVYSATAPTPAQQNTIDSSHSIGQNVLWACDLEVSDKDSQGVVISGATARDSNGVPLSGGTLATDAVDLSSLFTTGEFTILLRGIASGWSDNATLFRALSGGSTVMELGRNGSYTSTKASWPSLTYWGAGSNDFISTSLNVAQWAVTLNSTGLRIYREGSLLTTNADLTTITDGFGGVDTFVLGGGFSGTLKQALVANRAFSQAEVTSLFENFRQIFTS